MAANLSAADYNVTNYSAEALLPWEEQEQLLAVNLTGGGGEGGGDPAGVHLLLGGGVTGYNKPWPLLKQPTHMVVLLTLAYVIVLLLGVVNNSLVVSVIYRNPQLRSVTNYFIANLAVADIFVCIMVLPITLLTNILTEWWYGPVLCKVAPYLQGVAVSASVNTLAAVAIERYLAIFFPATSKMTPKAAGMIIGVIWSLPLAIFVPWIVVYQQKVYPVKGHEYIVCQTVWASHTSEKMYTLGAVFLTCYVIPLIFVAVFYLLIAMRVWKRRVRGIRGSRAERNIHKSKVRILRMLIVVFVIFVFSWLPLYSLNLKILFGAPQGEAEKSLVSRYLMPLAQWLGASNSCVNPFIYCYFSTSFRNSIKAVVRSRSCCGKINSLPTSS